MEWVDIIKPYSLVSIAFQRMGDSNDPATDPSPVPIMLGIVDTAQRADDYGDAAPRRSQRIVGRTLTGILEDHRYWFHNMLQEGFKPADYREFLLDRDTEVNLREEVELRTLGLLSVDEGMFLVSERHPVRLVEAGFEHFVRGTPDTPPFVSLNFSDGKALSERLIFEPEKAMAGHVDHRAALPISQVPNHLTGASLFDVLQLAGGQAPYMEIFSEVIGTSLGNAQAEIVLRKPPWAGHVDYNGAEAAVAFATPTGRPAFRGQSLFDEVYGAWNIHNETVEVDNSDVVSVSHLSRSSKDRPIYTLYQVVPVIAESNYGQRDELWKAIIPPVIEEDPESPSYIKRFGVRPFDHKEKSVPVADDHPSGDIARRCLVYATLAREWFYRNPEFWHGVYVLKGRPSLRIGKRLVDRNLSREYYITSVSHRMSFDRDPSYLTTVQVERGWDLSLGVL